MMYVIYNYDGSIKHKMLNEFVQQGNSYENVLFVGFENRQPEDYSLYATFKLPNNNTTTVVSTDQEETCEVGGKVYHGKTISLSNAETLVDGALQMNINVMTNDTNKVLVSFSTYLTINKTGIMPSDPVTITKAEYENLLAQIGEQVKKYETIYKLNVLPDEFDDYRVGQAIYVKNGATKLYEVILAVDNVHKTVQEVFDFTQAELKGRISAIENVIPSQASSSNKLADKDWTLQKINEEASYKITKNIQGQNFATFSELENATTFYSGGVVRIPTRNDYAYVIADETHNGVTTKYTYQGGTYPTGRWEFDVEISETPLTDEQFAALNSGATEELINLLKNGKIQSVNIQYLTTTLADLYSMIGGDFGVFKPSDNEDSFMTFSSYLDTTQTPPARRYNVTLFGARSYQEYSTLDSSKTLYNVFFATNPLATKYEYFTKNLIETSNDGLTESDSKVPSSKLVKGQLDEIREIASGLSTTYTADYTETVATLKTKFNNGMTIYKWDGYEDDFVEIASATELDSLTIRNSALNSQNYELDLSTVLGSTGFLAIQKSATEMYLIADGSHGIPLLKNNDNVLIINANVPDRWYSNGKLYAVQTKDLTKTNNAWEGENEFRDDVTFREDVYFENAELKFGGETIDLYDVLGNCYKTVNYNSSSVVISPKSNQFIFCKVALSSLLINVFQIASANVVPQWRITFKAASNFVLTLPSAKTVKWAEGEPIWNTTDTYTLVITEGIDTDYIIYVARG